MTDLNAAETSSAPVEAQNDFHIPDVDEESEEEGESYAMTLRSDGTLVRHDNGNAFPSPERMMLAERAQAVACWPPSPQQRSYYFFPACCACTSWTQADAQVDSIKAQEGQEEEALGLMTLAAGLVFDSWASNHEFYLWPEPTVRNHSRVDVKHVECL